MDLETCLRPVAPPAPRIPAETRRYLRMEGVHALPPPPRRGPGVVRRLARRLLRHNARPPARVRPARGRPEQR